MYEELVQKARKDIAVLTLRQQKELKEIYDRAVEGMVQTFMDSLDKGNKLDIDFATAYYPVITKARDQLAKDMENKITKATKEAAAIGTEPEQEVMKQILSKAGIKIGDDFKSFFTQVQDNVVKDIIKGKIYRDNKTLSERVWGTADQFGKDIQYIIGQGLLEKKSAVELAKDLEKFVQPAAQRDWDWGRTYPQLAGTYADYNAVRLARTSINHAYQTATTQATNSNPFVDFIEWHSALDHSSTCEICWERHGHRFKKNEVPLDHPNGMCTIFPIIDDLEDVALELKAWIEGNENKKLDKWYKKYGERFGGIKVATKSKIKPKSTIADENQKRIEKIENQNWVKKIKEEDRKELLAYFNKMTDIELEFWEYFGDLIKGNFYYSGNGAHYSPDTKEINLNIKKVDERHKRIGDKKANITFFHEAGHLFDDLIGTQRRVWKTIRLFQTKLGNGYLDFANKLLKSENMEPIIHEQMWNIDKLPKHKKILNKELRKDVALTSSISDILEPLSNGGIGGHKNFHYGHGMSYWKKQSVGVEAFAHFFEAKMIKGERLDIIKEYFPEAYNNFEKTFNELVERKRGK